MEETQLYNISLLIWISLTPIIFFSVKKFTAPYGRYYHQRFGPSIDSKTGWVLMEVVSPITLLLTFFSFNQTKSAVAWLICSFWLFHYAYRSFIFPFKQRTRGKRMPLAIMFSAIFFNLINGLLNGYYLGTFAHLYSANWLTEWRFLAGCLLFFSGFYMHFHSDNILINLRAPGETGYKIAHKGLFRWISSPNYLGEIIEWGGFALLTWSLPALSFLLWTIANLAPRALHNHQWYHQNFPHYPAERKALIPKVI